MPVCNRFHRLSILVLVLLLVVASPVFGADFSDPDYQAAVQATAAPLTQNRVYDDLWALTRDAEHPLWFDSQGRVLMVTWTSTWYDGWEGKDYVLDAAYEVWMAPVGEVRAFFSENGRTYSLRRLEQAYGLPPESGYTRMVTMWVDPADLVRPCPDPAVSDCLCETDFPVGQAITVDEVYKNWFSNRRATIYNCDSGDCYPWTGLGYTYDWGPDADADHVGVSEYLKPQGYAATVTVESVQETDAYFRSAAVPARWLSLQ